MNKFLVEFQSATEKHRVLLERPWSFDKFLLCIQDCVGCTTSKDITFTRESFWIQLHDLLFVGMNKTMGERLGATIGFVITVDVDANDMAWGSYVRVKVLVDISKPLAIGHFLNMGEKRLWISFKYERLPMFCFQFGVIMHVKLRCPSSTSDGGSREGQPAQYGPWLGPVPSQKLPRISIEGGNGLKIQTIGPKQV
ncbi:hypothetical protein F2P56_035300 [Juglans regia]|uniref:Uncharacterized protein LOC109007451 n=2 Tax=Juglans regia TaxID=51240 RepID=A0A2I4GFJ2_JUGRE|nr:uncharacterized protein LOC109007451 [Juglans regia]KAF5442667.1 hypothetical protein F2P56_035300 [Juglans regia]